MLGSIQQQMRHDGKNMDKWGYTYLLRRKHCGKKEKLLVKSNFSFTYDFFLTSTGQRPASCFHGVVSVVRASLDLDMYTADDEMSKFVNIPPRVSKDMVIDRNGRRLIQLCQSTSSIIGNGRLGSDLHSCDFTYHSIHGSSVVDYCILNIDDFYCITGFWVLQPNEYWDHSGIAINLHGNYSSSNTCIQDNHTNKDTARPIKWNSSKLTEFNAILLTKNDELKQLEKSVSNGDDTDSITNSLSKILYEIANIAFNNDRQQDYSQKHANVKKVKKNLWFNSDCYNARKQFNKCRNIYIKDKTSFDKRLFFKSKI